MRIPEFHEIAAAAVRLRDRVIRTPLVRSDWLSNRTGADVWLKLENLQREGSFKTRGAFNALLASPVDGAVAASAGNHGRALAFAAGVMRVPVTIFTPRTAPRAKTDPIRRHGATLELCDSYDAAEARGRAFAREQGLKYISPYNDPDVIAGAATIALEVFDDLPAVDVIVVAVGGGGLVSGLALAAREKSPGTSVMGVEAAASPVFTTALAQGSLIEVEVRPTLADGLAGNAEPGSITFDIVRDLEVPVTAVTEEHIADAMRGLEAYERQIVEGAGATGVAGLLAGIDVKGKRVAVIVSGGNVDRSEQKEPHTQGQQDERQHGP